MVQKSIPSVALLLVACFLGEHEVVSFNSQVSFLKGSRPLSIEQLFNSRNDYFNSFGSDDYDYNNFMPNDGADTRTNPRSVNDRNDYTSRERGQDGFYMRGREKVTRYNSDDFDRPTQVMSSSTGNMYNSNKKSMQGSSTDYLSSLNPVEKEQNQGQRPEREYSTFMRRERPERKIRMNFQDFDEDLSMDVYNQGINGNTFNDGPALTDVEKEHLKQMRQERAQQRRIRMNFQDFDEDFTMDFYNRGMNADSLKEVPALTDEEKQELEQMRRERMQQRKIRMNFQDFDEDVSMGTYNQGINGKSFNEVPSLTDEEKQELEQMRRERMQQRRIKMSIDDFDSDDTMDFYNRGMNAESLKEVPSLTDEEKKELEQMRRERMQQRRIRMNFQDFDEDVTMNFYNQGINGESLKDVPALTDEEKQELEQMRRERMQQRRIKMSIDDFDSDDTMDFYNQGMNADSLNEAPTLTDEEKQELEQMRRQRMQQRRIKMSIDDFDSDDTMDFYNRGMNAESLKEVPSLTDEEKKELEQMRRERMQQRRIKMSIDDFDSDDTMNFYNQGINGEFLNNIPALTDEEKEARMQMRRERMQRRVRCNFQDFDENHNQYYGYDQIKIHEEMDNTLEKSEESTKETNAETTEKAAQPASTDYLSAL